MCASAPPESQAIPQAAILLCLILSLSEYRSLSFSLSVPIDLAYWQTSQGRVFVYCCFFLASSTLLTILGTHYQKAQHPPYPSPKPTKKYKKIQKDLHKKNENKQTSFFCHSPPPASTTGPSLNRPANRRRPAPRARSSAPSPAASLRRSG